MINIKAKSNQANKVHNDSNTIYAIFIKIRRNPYAYKYWKINRIYQGQDTQNVSTLTASRHNACWIPYALSSSETTSLPYSNSEAVPQQEFNSNVW